MMSYVCKVDNTNHSTLKDLHLYLRKFKIKIEDYYTEYYPRFDLFTKEPIKFKSFEQYFSQDFLDKNNLRKYVQANPKEGKEWALDFLVKRREKKNTKYAFSQVELKSLVCPTMHYYNDIGGYYNITDSIGFTPRYKEQILKFTPLPKDTVIIEDTREQLPLNLPYKTISEKVECGDYALHAAQDKKIYIERKSLNDFIGTLSIKNFERFEKEIKRAVDNGSYLVMLVESEIEQALSFHNLFFAKKYVKVTPDHIFYNLRELLNKYPLNFQVLFVDGRIEASQKMIKIFELGEQVKQVDLQFYYEIGEL